MDREHRKIGIEICTFCQIDDIQPAIGMEITVYPYPLLKMHTNLFMQFAQKFHAKFSTIL